MSITAAPLAPSARKASDPTTVVAPVTGWRRALGDCAVVGGATTVCHLLGAVTSLLLKMLVSPAQMGIWQALKLVMNYGNYANLGISKGATRELAVARGLGDTRTAEHGLNLAHAVNTLTSLIYAAVLVGAGAWIGCTGTGPWTAAWAWGLATVGVLAAVQRYVTFQVTILRTRQAFTTCSKISILEAVLTLVACGLATWCWGLPGLYAGTLVVMLGTLIFLHRSGAVGLSWAWDTAEIRRLVVIGAPILLAGTVSSLFRSLDRLMILGYLPDREFQLGCYSLTLMVTVQLYGLANMMSVVMGPRYGEMYGRHGRRRDVARLAARASELQAAAIALPAAIALTVAPPLLGWLLPDYQTGLVPLAWLIPGAVALAVALPAGQYLVAVDHQRRALVAVSIATVLAAVGNHVALAGGHGLAGVAVATSLGYAAYLVILVAGSLWKELERGDRIRYVGMLGLAVVPVMASALLLERLWPAVSCRFSETVFKVAVVLVLWIVTTAVGWHAGRWSQQIRKPAGE